MAPVHSDVRRCKTCGIKLSVYNDDVVCFPCQKKKRDEILTRAFEKPLRPKIVLKTIII